MIPPWLLEICRRLSRNDPQLTNLNLNIRRFDAEMLQALSTALETNTVLHTLNLTSLLVKASLTPLMHSVISRHPSLQVLHLSYNRISNVEELSLALASNTCLRELYLDHNQVNAKGAQCLAQALRENTSLQGLQLSCNALGDDGAEAFAAVLEHDNSSLKRLCLKQTKISSRGVECLLQAMQANISLQHLELDKRSTSVYQELSLLLQLNRAGRHLLRHQDEFPLALWSHVLQKSCKQPDVLNFFVQQVPTLCQRR